MLPTNMNHQLIAIIQYVMMSKSNAMTIQQMRQFSDLTWGILIATNQTLNPYLYLRLNLGDLQYECRFDIYAVINPSKNPWI